MINHARLLTAMVKTGATIEQNGTRFVARGVRNVSWSNQEGTAVCVSTLYCEGSYWCHKTIKSAVTLIVKGSF